MIRMIKRYGGGSRKLYDTEESRYISLEEIAGWVREGQQLQVLDSANGEDVTAQTLAQVIYEDQKKGHSLLPSDLLHDVIRRGRRAISTRVGKLQSGVDRLVRNSVDRLTPVTGAQREMDLLRARLADLERSLGALEQARPTGQDPKGGTKRRGRKRGSRSGAARPKR